MKQFYLICPIGLEKCVLSELKLKYPKIEGIEQFTIHSVDSGGILLESELEIGFGMNKVLKTPTRILLRLKSQKCKDYPKLFNIIKKYDWKKYLQQTHIDWICKASKSRLIHTGKMEKACQDGIKSYFNANKLPEKILEKTKHLPNQKIYIRIHEDELTISLDTTGELAHIRGDRSFRGHASIRETYAASLLLELKETLDLKAETYNLIDPMCGTGTFLFEGLNFYSKNKRQYSFEHFKLAHWEYTEVKNPNLFKNYIGLDQDDSIIQKNKEYKSTIEFQCKDLFETEDDNTIKNAIIIINPPYGKRVRIKNDKIDYFKKLIQSLKDNYSPKGIGIIIPRDFASAIKADHRLAFNQNGIKVEFLIIK